MRLHSFVVTVFAMSYLFFAGEIAQAASRNVTAKKWIDIVQNESVVKSLQRAEPSQRKQIEKAIRIANAFLHMHYDGSVYSFDPGYVRWSRETGMLVTMTGKALEDRQEPSAENYEIERTLIKGQPDAGQLDARWIVCSTVHLIQVDLGATGIWVHYDAQRIGYKMVMHGPEGRFIIPSAPDKDRVVIVVNSVEQVAHMKSFGRAAAPYRAVREGQEYFLQQRPKDIGGIGVSEKTVLEWKAIVRQEMHDVKKAEAQFCYPDQ